MSSAIAFKHRIQRWQVVVCFIVSAYLALGLATNSIHVYHWFMLLAIPAAFLDVKRGRRFFVDWAPLFAFWLVYDRLRLIQPLFYDRVSVERPFLIERWAFGWMTKGVIPAHAAHAWLATHTGALVLGVESVAQIVYFSHLFVVPLVIVALWILGNSREGYRTAFLQHIGALTVLNFSAIVFYLLLPVAPPWWVTLNGMARPTPGLVAEVNMAAAMNGSLVQGMIRNASGWFAAVPSLHGAYPVLLLLLSPWRRNRRTLACFAAYACAMWSATVVLNQHYIIDLLAGAFLAVTAWWVAISASFARVYKAGRSHTT